ncbi:MAG TPA: hypothetical protein VEA99_04075 [Gemmatimonadaceae bacterium]|nr:hypothetical protein [Gemmatimonadaceae bacterium]
MAHREFTDEQGIRWEVWDVHPTHVERRRDGIVQLGSATERRHQRSGPRMQVRQEFANGWLAFQCRGERRRLAPVPPDWAELDERELASLCSRATPIGSPRRLVE